MRWNWKSSDYQIKCLGNGILGNFLIIFFSVYAWQLHGDSHIAQAKQQKGTIIILNGPPAAGKTSIQNAIQKKFDQLYLKMGIDAFFEELIPIPDLSSFETTQKFAQYTNDGVLIRSVKINKDDEGNQVFTYGFGPAGDKIFSGMHYAIAAYSNQGNNVVVDYILFKPDWLPDLVEALKDHTVYLVGLRAPIEVLEKREKNRGTSPVGQARSLYQTVHKGLIYDLALDVGKLTPEQSAQKIQAFIKENPQPTALKRLVKQFENQKKT